MAMQELKNRMMEKINIQAKKLNSPGLSAIDYERGYYAGLSDSLIVIEQFEKDLRKAIEDAKSKKEE